MPRNDVTEGLRESRARRSLCPGSRLPAAGTIYPLCQLCGREFSAQGRKAQARLGNAWQRIPPHFVEVEDA